MLSTAVEGRPQAHPSGKEFHLLGSFPPLLHIWVSSAWQCDNMTSISKQKPKRFLWGWASLCCTKRWWLRSSVPQCFHFDVPTRLVVFNLFRVMAPLHHLFECGDTTGWELQFISVLFNQVLLLQIKLPCIPAANPNWEGLLHTHAPPALGLSNQLKTAAAASWCSSFWSGAPYASHENRFTGQPSYSLLFLQEGA